MGCLLEQLDGTGGIARRADGVDDPDDVDEVLRRSCDLQQ
jgi:hypothetical protein